MQMSKDERRIRKNTIQRRKPMHRGLYRMDRTSPKNQPHGVSCGF